MNPISHFAINADDIEATRAFYEQTFGWRFQPWGPPGFLQIFVGDQLVGALQRRRELEPGLRLNAFECTIGVADVAATVVAAEQAGGRILMPPVRIPGVGTLAFASDPSGNVFGAMQYE
jgi:predicted enzyme related to lactoylglutathione lyase